jgi:hypothetical protein
MPEVDDINYISIIILVKLKFHLLEGFIYEKTTFATHVSNNGLLSFFIN